MKRLVGLGLGGGKIVGNTRTHTSMFSRLLSRLNYLAVPTRLGDEIAGHRERGERVCEREILTEGRDGRSVEGNIN